MLMQVIFNRLYFNLKNTQILDEFLIVKRWRLIYKIKIIYTLCCGGFYKRKRELCCD